MGEFGKSNGVILLTDEGVKLIGSIQCSNGGWFDSEGCFKYCNSCGTEFNNKHQAFKLKASATSMNVRPNMKDENWYKDRNNFIDVTINYSVDQTYNIDGLLK